MNFYSHVDGGHQVGEYAKFIIQAKHPTHQFEDLSSDQIIPHVLTEQRRF